MSRRRVKSMRPVTRDGEERDLRMRDYEGEGTTEMRLKSSQQAITDTPKTTPSFPPILSRMQYCNITAITLTLYT